MSESLFPEDVAPPAYTIVDQRGEGVEMVTDVILDGELITFSVPLSVYRAGRFLKSEG